MSDNAEPAVRAHLLLVARALGPIYHLARLHECVRAYAALGLVVRGSQTDSPDSLRTPRVHAGCGFRDAYQTPRT